MTAAAHTPGPWESDWQFIVAPDPNGVHPDIYIAEITETDEDGRVASPEQQEANALLIAAAPDIRAALEEALIAIEDATDMLQAHDEDGNPIDGKSTESLNAEAIKQVYYRLCGVIVQSDEALRRAVIAKAKGGAA
jgi:hypothetical protein